MVQGVDRVRGELESERTSRNNPGLSNTSSMGARASCLPAQELQHPLTLQLCPWGVSCHGCSPGSSVQTHLELLCPVSLQSHQTVFTSLKPKALNSLQPQGLCTSCHHPPQVSRSITYSKMLFLTPISI